MSRTLYVTDLDGTLLAPDATVSAETARIMRRLAADGVMVTCATARTPATVDPLLADCNIPLPGVVMTGAADWDFAAKAYRNVKFITPEVVRAIDDIFAGETMKPFVYTLPDVKAPLQVYHSGQLLNDYERRFYHERSHLPLKYFHLGATPNAGLDSCHILYFAMGDPATVDRIAARLYDLPGCYISNYRDTYDPGIGLIEVFADKVDKASAVSELKRRSGADRLVVFGDNLNDLSMFAVADTAVAVENALPQVKERADVVIGPNSADAVPRYIAKQEGIVI